MTTFEIVEVEEIPYLFVDRSTTRDPADIARAMGSAFTEVWAFLQAKHIVPAGGALSVYYGYDAEQMEFRAGFTIGRSDLARAAGAVKGDVTPGGRVIHGTHRGPYAGIRESYSDMRTFVAAQGGQWKAPTWEIYLNSPDQVPENELLTELYQAIAE